MSKRETPKKPEPAPSAAKVSEAQRSAAKKAPWFKDGLQFSCTQCGKCCTGAPGYVWVNDEEIATLAVRSGLDVEAFQRRYTRVVRGRGRTLVERPDGKRGSACVFWQDGVGCTVYTDRPKQCRTWPFWRPLIQDQDSWEDAAQSCPGMNHGKRHDAATITAIAADDGLSIPSA